MSLNSRPQLLLANKVAHIEMILLDRTIPHGEIMKHKSRIRSLIGSHILNSVKMRDSDLDEGHVPDTLLELTYYVNNIIITTDEALITTLSTIHDMTVDLGKDNHNKHL